MQHRYIFILQITHYLMGFPSGSVAKNMPDNAGDAGLISRSKKSPGEENGNPLQYSCLENPHGQRSLEGYSPWGRKESDTTGRLSAAQNWLFRSY